MAQSAGSSSVDQDFFRPIGRETSVAMLAGFAALRPSRATRIQIALAHLERTERDHAALAAAAREGRVPVAEQTDAARD